MARKNLKRKEKNSGATTRTEKINTNIHVARCSICNSPLKEDLEKAWKSYVPVHKIFEKYESVLEDPNYETFRKALPNHCEVFGIKRSTIPALERLAEVGVAQISKDTEISPNLTYRILETIAKIKGEFDAPNLFEESKQDISELSNEDIVHSVLEKLQEDG